MRNAVLVLLLAVPPLDDDWDIPSVPAGLAKEAFDTRVDEALNRYGEKLNLALPDWEAELRRHEKTLADSRVVLLDAVLKAIDKQSQRGEVEESLKLDRARAILEGDDEVPLFEKRGTRGAIRGAKSFGKHKYVVVTEPAPWHVARRSCTEMQGYLASAETEEELEFLATLVEGRSWVGATDAESEGKWVWTNGAPLLAAGWVDGQPDNWRGIEHVAAIEKEGLLFDLEEDKRLPFVCEWGDAVPDPWNFESPSARQAKERYDRDAAESAESLGAIRRRLDRRLEHERDECNKLLVTAQRILVDDLEDAVRTETRRRRMDVVTDLRSLMERTKEGAFTPSIGPFGAPAVPDDAVRFRGHRYAIVRDPLPWQMARDRCRELGGTLAILSTADELALSRELAGETHAWVGATDVEQEGEWRWVDGSAVERGWRAGEPNDARKAEHALVVVDGEFFDVPSGHREIFLCEWEY